MSNSKVLVVNKGYCPNCDEDLQSKYRHDFVMCSCGESGLDGGTDYIRVIGKTFTEPLYSDDDFEIVREFFPISRELNLFQYPNEDLFLLDIFHSQNKQETPFEEAFVELLRKEIQYRAKHNINVIKKQK